jgi:hypothetical protein
MLPAAAGGLVAGHFLTYVFVAPAGPHRAAFLRQTGHGYLARAVAVAAALSAIAIGTVAARGVARRRSSGTGTLAMRTLALRFAILQSVGFVLLEIGERLVVHAPLGGLLSVLPLGLAIETLVGGAVAWLLCLTERASQAIAETLVRRRRRRVAPRVVPASVVIDVTPALRFFGSSVSLRGPPFPSFV